MALTPLLLAVTAAAGNLLGAVLLSLAAFVGEDPLAMAWTWRGALATLYLALFGTALTFGVYFWLLRTAPASMMSLISYVTPVLAMLLSTAFESYRWTWIAVAGVALAVAGNAIALRGSRKAPVTRT